jgi:hypothetical protein
MCLSITVPSNAARTSNDARCSLLDDGEHVAGLDRVADVLPHLADDAGEARGDVCDAVGVRAHLAGELDAEVDLARGPRSRGGRPSARSRRP